MSAQPPNEVIAKPERRQFYRKKFHGTLEVEWGSAVLNGTVRDIGPRGLFVEIRPPLWLGATFRARLLLEPALVLDCRVVRIEPENGNATVFEIPEEDGKARYEALLKSLPSI
jgi:PilZ domain-containing protein